MCMDQLVHLSSSDGIEEFLERAAWHGVDGIEADISGMTEEEYILVKGYLRNCVVPTQSLHYERTSTISLKEWDLFRSQLEMLVERAEELNCGMLSVHPPRVEKETSNTMKDLQEFIQQVDDYAAAADVELCFELTGFMKDPQMINAGFEHLNDPSLGVMIDLDQLTDGVNPLHILQKLDVNIHKVRFPVSLQRMEDDFNLGTDDVAVVASSIE